MVSNCIFELEKEGRHFDFPTVRGLLKEQRLHSWTRKWNWILSFSLYTHKHIIHSEEINTYKIDIKEGAEKYETEFKFHRV